MPYDKNRSDENGAAQSPEAADGAARHLEQDLKARVDGEVRFDSGSRALYTMDASNYREAPIGVVLPRSVDAIAAAVAVCRDHDVPILMRGGGTSLGGQTTNAAVVIDASKYCNAIIDIDPGRRIATVEPGVVLDDLRAAAFSRHKLTFGPDPSTHSWCTLGGMIGNNACGVHALMAGRTSDNVEELEIVTYDGLRMRVGPTPDDALERIIAEGGRRGEIYAGLRDLRDRYADRIRACFPQIPRRVSGYNLDELLPERGFHVARALVGSEGTLATVLRAKLRLVPWPEHRVLVVVGYDSVFHAADAIPKLRDLQPLGIEAIDEKLIEDMRKKNMRQEDVKLLPQGSSFLLVQFGADDPGQAKDIAQAALERIEGDPEMRGVQGADIIADESQRARIWEVREAALAATAWVPDSDDTWPGWEDSAVAPEDLGAYARDLYGLYDKYGYRGALYGHFGDGLIHTRISFHLRSQDETEKYGRFVKEAAELIARYRGSLSGEHGDGLARSALLPIMFGSEIVQAFEEFKAIWDPRARMNPGRIVNAPAPTQHLRIGPGFRAREPETTFSFHENHFSFVQAAMRCVGVGKCRKMRGGVMCPSYRATREERHSTRGRAHTLQEMLRGDPVATSWQSEEVHDALDLCLSCKGCKSDCPVNVDMATYKAEFHSHYYRKRMRPRDALSMGRIHVWTRLIERAPWLGNIVTQTPGISRIAKEIGGIHPLRPLPSFARKTFRSGYRATRNGNGGNAGNGNKGGRPLVVLWTDTFNNFFSPNALSAAAEVLEDAGYRVEIPATNLCCGRPLYEYGLLKDAKRLLKQTMAGLNHQLDQGACVVGVEPSCMATFKDELVNLFPDDAQAKRLAERSFLFAEFLDTVAHYQPPRIEATAIVHCHCNHKAIFGMDSDGALLNKTGMDFEILGNGCCGMAGPFGYITHKYDVSKKIYEHELAPAIDTASRQTLIISDGFSCREQIRQLAGRETTSLPEVLAGALRRG
jgi:FAD/FMN-containing dehydrogenase/Fe-S oxidoreductase